MRGRSLRCALIDEAGVEWAIADAGLDAAGRAGRLGQLSFQRIDECHSSASLVSGGNGGANLDGQINSRCWSRLLPVSTKFIALAGHKLSRLWRMGREHCGGQCHCRAAMLMAAAKKQVFGQVGIDMIAAHRNISGR